ncbi:MAG: DUF3604 domain-containing protein [Halioglobus sp.]
MLKRISIGLMLVVLAGAAFLWFVTLAPMHELTAAASPATALDDYALQDDSRVTLPKPLPLQARAYNPLKNVYWGELHIHTQESFDAKLFGNSLGVEDAYRFARGEPLRSDGGELMQLSRPLDFLAITDHSESFGLRTRCADEGLSWNEKINCYFLETPSLSVFLLIRALAGQEDEALAQGEPGVYRNRARPRLDYQSWPICRDESDPDRCYRDSNSDWARYRALADQYNEPGVLTTFAGYEFSPSLPQSGKHHRNVIFNGDDLPTHAVSSLDVGNAIELWRELETTCRGGCDFLTIPHNMNKGWGLFYSPYTWDGKAYDEAGWRLRQAREPIAEMYQVKGASECALGVGATDEECAFGQVLPPCEAGELGGCAFNSSFARQGLKIGLQLERDKGFNPLAFGFIAATDTHNANPGDAEEWDYVGKIGTVTSPAVRRMREWPDRKPYESNLQHHTSGGLAAVWAEENTRDALFSAMQRKETYATSGPRIGLRFFAGWGFDEEIKNDPGAIALATGAGVPMGGTLQPFDAGRESPAFFVWASADPLSAPLQRIQMVKGWIDEQGVTHEVVSDIACAGGVAVDATTARCPAGNAGVDTSDCSLTGSGGAAELSVVWRDPHYSPQQSAFYYTRVLQNPTCRWSTYDAIRLGQEPPPQVPATIRERAWSSPIWLQAVD